MIYLKSFHMLNREEEEAALACGHFSRDDEEECFASEDVTCYNCRYRRWTADGFECMKG